MPSPCRTPDGSASQRCSPGRPRPGNWKTRRARRGGEGGLGESGWVGVPVDGGVARPLLSRAGRGVGRPEGPGPPSRFVRSPQLTNRPPSPLSFSLSSPLFPPPQVLKGTAGSARYRNLMLSVDSPALAMGTGAKPAETLISVLAGGGPRSRSAHAILSPRSADAQARAEASKLGATGKSSTLSRVRNSTAGGAGRAGPPFPISLRVMLRAGLIFIPCPGQ